MSVSTRTVVCVILCLCGVSACGPGTGNEETPEYMDFAYVTNKSSEAILGFRISGAGELTRIFAYPFAAGDIILYIAITPDGKFMYAAGNPATIFKINASTGALTWLENSFDLNEAMSIYIDPLGGFLFKNWASSGEYVTIEGLSVLRIDRMTGALTATEGHGPAYVDGSVVFDPEGKFAYMTTEENDLFVYAIDPETGALSETPGSPYPVGSDRGMDPYNGSAIGPGGAYLYVAGSQGISVFARDMVSGALAEIEGSPFVSGNFPLTIVVDPSGRFAYAASLPTNLLYAYSIDPATGALTEVEGSPYVLPAMPHSLAMSPSGSSLYVTVPQANAVWVYTVDNDSGALTPLSGSPVQAGTSPERIVTIRIRQGAGR